MSLNHCKSSKAHDVGQTDSSVVLMGNQVSIVPTQLYSVEDYFSDLQEYEFVEKMGSTRFLKVARWVLSVLLL